VNGRRKREREEDRTRLAELTKHVYALEQAAGEHAEPARREVLPEARPVPPPPVAPRPSAPKPNPPPPQVDVSATATPVITAPSAVFVPPPVFPKSEPAASMMDRFKGWLDIEETLGTNWLNKLGTVILVPGVAFFLAYQLKTLGPAGKILMGYFVGGVLLGAGIWFERWDRYRILARAGVGGGWALLFFTTYAMYHIPAAQVLRSQLTDLVLLLAVAAAMVWHTLRYRSQVVTGLAFLLAFLTVTVSHSNVYSLSAGAVGRMQWFELEIFGILASYLNHYLWLRPIIESMRGHRQPFPEFAASVGILSLYWLRPWFLHRPGRSYLRNATRRNFRRPSFDCDSFRSVAALRK
jgi:uncharacterized membrane protein